MQTTEITAINGNILSIKDPLHLDFPAGADLSGGESQEWHTVPLDTSAAGMGNRWSGIEDIAVAGGNTQFGFPGGTVAFSYMAYAHGNNVLGGRMTANRRGVGGNWDNGYAASHI